MDFAQHNFEPIMSPKIVWQLNCAYHDSRKRTISQSQQPSSTDDNKYNITFITASHITLYTNSQITRAVLHSNEENAVHAPPAKSLQCRYLQAIKFTTCSITITSVCFCLFCTITRHLRFRMYVKDGLWYVTVLFLILIIFHASFVMCNILLFDSNTRAIHCNTYTSNLHDNKRPQFSSTHVCAYATNIPLRRPASSHQHNVSQAVYI